MLSQLPILLEHVNNFIDLGVTISKVLSWSNDIKKIMDKVSKVLHYIKFLLGTLMQMFFLTVSFPCMSNLGIHGTCLVVISPWTLIPSRVYREKCGEQLL